MVASSSGGAGSPPPPPETHVEPFAPVLMKRYYATLDHLWTLVPPWAGSAVASALVFLLGATIRAEWLMILVHFLKWSKGADEPPSPASAPLEAADLAGWMKSRFAGFLHIWLIASLVGYVIYFGVGGFLHWYYYRMRRDSAHEWKCQPEKWLPPDLEWHEIKYGSTSLMIGNTLSSLLVCWVLNGGYSTIYYHVADFGWTWWLLSWPVVFIWQDYVTYLTHRLYHTPFLYKHFHKLHHTYKQPTAFSVTAIHPVEFIHVQAIIISPMFLVPVHWVVMSVLLLYTYYHGIVDHSGINFKAHWWQPWQPDCLFHDNHHQYFHVNFGFNIFLWDKLHGTYRRKDRIYRENIFYGRGKPLEQCSQGELASEMAERTSENASAYQSSQHKQDMVNEVRQKLA
ncbi:delta(7)-sterol 5(6)-desaturase-like [Pollicipes pollicipes]|uniref:delta(7)-sterol 5(6)-desaturase-like n=1 Tax=Pollicipes pollicipes TaxID=41117 RepID=UPI00188568A5|nr:delta(7)-sterol 5(6)-desaturase-like [Pollicipes pollicipes]